jgi:hypothetical protein
MLEQLRIADSQGVILNEAEYANCLACHNPQPPRELRGATFHPREGVGCEACHGPAGSWIATHHLDRERGPAANPGMTDTKNLWTRALLCAECHVGSSDRAVSHDLIAAGHPALKFELAAYHELLPKHWNEAAQRQGRPDHEVRLWGAGQVGSASAALRLLSMRARGAQVGRTTAWPELAEYDCFDCHQELRGALNAPADSGGRAPGRAAWGTWYFDLLIHAAVRDEDSAAQAAARALEQLRRTMESGFFADPVQVAAEAQSALDGLELWQGRAAAEDELPRPWRQLLVLADDSGFRRDLFASWDVAAQTYLAMVAADHAYHDRRLQTGQPATARDASIREGLRRVRGELVFAEGYESPLPPLDASRAFEPRRQSLLELLRAVRSRAEE